jgi:hypothetical protein
VQTLSIDASFNDPPDQGSISGTGASSVFEAAASCGVTSFSLNLYGNTDINSSIAVMGQKFRNFKSLESLQLQFYVINPDDRDAGDVFATDLGAGIASMRESLTQISLDMSCNQVSDTGVAALGAGDCVFVNACHIGIVSICDMMYNCRSTSSIVALNASSHSHSFLLHSSCRSCLSPESNHGKLSIGGVRSAHF